MPAPRTATHARTTTRRTTRWELGTSHDPGRNPERLGRDVGGCDDPGPDPRLCPARHRAGGLAPLPPQDVGPARPRPVLPRPVAPGEPPADPVSLVAAVGLGPPGDRASLVLGTTVGRGPGVEGRGR